MPTSQAHMVAGVGSKAREISPAEAAYAHEHFEIYLIVDVREPNEYDEGHIPDAVNIPRGLLELHADPGSPVADAALSADQSARILVYGTEGAGTRSLLAAQTLSSMGYEHVEVLGGGLRAWAETGLPVASIRSVTSSQTSK
jgi:rhodanese-related sulfurtransferase